MQKLSLKLRVKFSFTTIFRNFMHTKASCWQAFLHSLHEMLFLLKNENQMGT